MKAAEIRTKLAKYLISDKDVIILDMLQGTPYSEQGGCWTEIPVSFLEKLTENPNINLAEAGIQKHIDRWKKEGLI